MTELRYNKIKHGAAVWAGYYRANPHRFVEDYLHVRLKLFQKILLVMMNISMTMVYIASRGQAQASPRRKARAISGQNR
jgi:hypothetical protein